jgi:hypothetical protein
LRAPPLPLHVSWWGMKGKRRRFVGKYDGARSVGEARSIVLFVFTGLFAGVQKHAGQGFAVEDGALLDHFEDFGELNQTNFNFFIVFRMCAAGHQTFGQIDFHGFAKKAGAGVVLDQRLPLFGALDGFLGQFALCAEQGVFVGVELASG